MTVLAKWMDRTGATDAKVAEAIGVSQPQIYRIRCGKNRPSPETAVKLSALTGVPEWEFLRPDNADALAKSVTPIILFAGSG